MKTITRFHSIICRILNRQRQSLEFNILKKGVGFYIYMFMYNCGMYDLSAIGKGQNKIERELRNAHNFCNRYND